VPALNTPGQAPAPWLCSGPGPRDGEAPSADRPELPTRPRRPGRPVDRRGLAGFSTVRRGTSGVWFGAASRNIGSAKEGLPSVRRL